jgi:hypothetical protein
VRAGSKSAANARGVPRFGHRTGERVLRLRQLVRTHAFSLPRDSRMLVRSGNANRSRRFCAACLVAVLLLPCPAPFQKLEGCEAEEALWQSSLCGPRCDVRPTATTHTGFALASGSGEYNRALTHRGRLTVWFDEQAVAGWRNTEPAAGPGAPRLDADLALACALVFKSVYPLSLRAAQGLLSSVVERMKLPLPIPDSSSVSRRQRGLSTRLALTPCTRPRHVVIDATGLKGYGAGEWQGGKHRVSRRRTWRKLHLGIDERTKEIVAVEVTESRVHDSQPLPALLAQIPDPIGQVSGDGAYDTRACYAAVLQRGATPPFVPRRTAQPREGKDPTRWRAARNRILQQIEEQGRFPWRVLRGCTHQSIAENTMFRFKTLLGGRLWARGLKAQRTEALVKCSVRNHMTQLGMPEAVRIG